MLRHLIWLHYAEEGVVCKCIRRFDAYSNHCKIGQIMVRCEWRIIFALHFPQLRPWPEDIDFSIFGHNVDSLDIGLCLFLLIEAVRSLLSKWRAWKASACVSVRRVCWGTRMGEALFGLMRHRLVLRNEDEGGK